MNPTDADAGPGIQPEAKGHEAEGATRDDDADSNGQVLA